MDIAAIFLHCTAHIILPTYLFYRVCGKAIDTGRDGARREIIFFVTRRVPLLRTHKYYWLNWTTARTFYRYLPRHIHTFFDRAPPPVSCCFVRGYPSVGIRRYIKRLFYYIIYLYTLLLYLGLIYYAYELGHYTTPPPLVETTHKTAGRSLQ